MVDRLKNQDAKIKINLKTKTKNMNEKDPMAGMEKQEVKYNNLKFGEVGDWFRGTLTDNSRQIKNNLSEKGEMQTIYEFKAKGGSFHNIIKRKVDKDATIVEEGDFWSYITSKQAIVQQLKKAQLGTIVGFKFASVKPAKNEAWDDAKIIDIYIGDLDPDYQGEQQGD